MLKGIFDRLMAAIGLLVTSPLMGLLVVLIRIESPGPAVFKHLRVGKDGKLFFMFKFRKMRHGISTGPKISPKYDPRLTKVGRVMERLKLDELPQLFNILKGEMSFVGPRPEIPEIVSKYTKEQRRLLTVKPGLVGPNQIIWRNEKNLLPDDVVDVEAYYINHILPLKAAHDLCYIERANFLSDLGYVLMALGAVIFEPMKPIHLIRRKRQVLHLTMDLSLCTLAFAAALLIKYDSGITALLWSEALRFMPLLALLWFTAFVFLGVSQQVWEYVSKADLVMIIKAVLSTTAFAGILLLIVELQLSFMVVLLTGILSIVFMGGTRLALSLRKQQDSVSHERVRKNIMIYGANEEGELFLRRVMGNLGPKVQPLGFLDSDSMKRGGRIHGLPVLGNSSDLAMLKELHGIEEIYITERPNSNGGLDHLLQACRSAGIPYHFVMTSISTDSEWFTGSLVAQALGNNGTISNGINTNGTHTHKKVARSPEVPLRDELPLVRAATSTLANA